MTLEVPLSPTFLIYGANGYTGALTAREAVRRGLRPVLAGRNRREVTALSNELGLECRIFGLDNTGEVAAGLAGMACVLNCAGPFVRTAWPMIEGCLAARVHYLDITGEIAQFERLAARTAEARAAGIMFLPGAGFDVVPSDCLAGHLKRRLPSAVRLALGIRSAGGISRGTATTAIENAPQGAMVRRNSRIVTIPHGSLTRNIDFGRGPERSVILPWGDVATAFYSTGIPNIEVYFAFPQAMLLGIKASRYLSPALALGPVQRLLVGLVRARKAGPDETQRARGYSLLWGEVTDAAGNRVVSRLRTPESYHLTVLSSLKIVEKVLAGSAPPGYQTPSTAYGPDLVLELPGVTRSDE